MAKLQVVFMIHKDGKLIALHLPTLLIPASSNILADSLMEAIWLQFLSMNSPKSCSAYCSAYSF